MTSLPQSIPSLLYHSFNPPLYPTRSTTVPEAQKGENTASTPITAIDIVDDAASTDNESLLVVRFSGPVRISSIRIIPEGVECFDRIGTTHPPTFDAEILLNVSPSNPVNALARSVISVYPAEHALDYEINMPVGVTTRMMMLRSPAQKLTLSVYGYADSALTESDTNLQVTAASIANDVDSLMNDEMTGRKVQSTELDSSWIYSWAGLTPEALFDLLHDSVPPQISSRAMNCIDLLIDADVQNASVHRLLEHPTALTFALAQTDSSLRHRIYSSPTYALNPAVSSLLPLDHPLKPLVHPDSSRRHVEAWRNFQQGLGPLMILSEGAMAEDELLRVEKGQEQSTLVRLVDLAEECIRGTDAGHTRESAELALDILDRPGLTDEIALRYLARTLPRLVAISMLHRTTTTSVSANATAKRRRLNLPPNHSREVLESLVHVAGEVINGQSAAQVAEDLAQDFIWELKEKDPLRKIFERSKAEETSARDGHLTSQGGSPLLPVKDDADGRRLARLSSALDASYSFSVPRSDPTVSSSIFNSASPFAVHQLQEYQTKASSLLHSCSPAELISLLSPDLYTTLSTATVPSFGIESTSQTTDQGAKSFAGKVYTSHEFRRGADPSGLGAGAGVVGVGLGIIGGSGGSMGMGMGMGAEGSIGMGGTGGNSGSGPGGTVPGIASRPASRHVDAYTRAH